MTQVTSAVLGRIAVLTVIGMAVALLAGCGGSNASTAPSPTPAPTQAPARGSVTRVLYEGSGTLPVRLVKFFVLEIPATGTVGVTVDWTSATNGVWIYVARGSDPCTVEQLNAAQCSFVSFSETTAKPKTLTLPNLTAGAYTLYIGNRGPSDESFSFQVTITPAAGATEASTLSAPVRGPVQGGQWSGLLPAFR